MTNFPARLGMKSHFTNTKPRVLFADAHPVVLEGLRKIAEQAGFEVAGSVQDGDQLVEAALTLAPDLIVVDISIPGMSGIDAARSIRRRDPDVPILFLSMQTDEGNLGDAFEAVASGYVSKKAAVAEIGTAMREVLEHNACAATGGRKTSPDVAGGSVEGDRKLTRRQVEVLQLVTNGKTAKEVASALNISARTAEFHKTRIMETLSLRTIAELTRYAIRNNIVAS